jgi:hypothetical protein
MEEERFSRQQLLFGPEGQEKIRSSKVGVVGLGGIGSHVVQQLAYLGVEDFRLIDPDKVSKSNLNRVIGATESDIGSDKVLVSKRTIGLICNDARVNAIAKDSMSRDSFEALHECDFIFGCVDHDGPRLVLLEFCAAYLKPYLDVATDILVEGNEKDFGGRIVLSVVSPGCLYCWGELSQAEIREYLSSETDREIETRIYGGGAAGKSPSVISLNGLLASIAVTEFMVEVTGIRHARGFLKYHGNRGIVTDMTVKEKPREGCYYCWAVKGKGVSANVERFVTHRDALHHNLLG